MHTTDFHAKYYAHAILRRSSSSSVDKLSRSIRDATVDLNPHQIEAALFAFRSPLSRGAILADEVGLGKTIEAGLIISQLWPERRRKILIITPPTLCKQWSQELADKFFLPSEIFDSRVAAARQKAGQVNPFDGAGQIVICSYYFARANEHSVRSTPWDLVVIDEAHRLRNVIRSGNKIAKAIHAAIHGFPKNKTLPMKAEYSSAEDDALENAPADVCKVSNDRWQAGINKKWRFYFRVVGSNPTWGARPSFHFRLPY